MQNSIFKISKMDCPSEEQMIRMQLAELSNIKSLIFDIPKRQLTVIHTETYHNIFEQLNKLNFGTTYVESIESNDIIEDTRNNKKEMTILWKVLLINFLLFIIELSTGLMSFSMGLVADSLDMLADSIVYGLALLAVGSTMLFKKRIAKIAGFIQLLLAILGFIEVIRRFIGIENLPDFTTMITISSLALIGNGLCLYLLQNNNNNNNDDAHMQASVIFTSNDIIINAGVILAGILVYLSNSKYPDLLIGTLVFMFVINGAKNILKIAK